MAITVLDGPVGTELLRRGVPTPPPAWSSAALRDAPEVVAAIHADYARAGAMVHTTNTFRTRPAVWGAAWADLARVAVRLAQGAGGRVAGSIAPLADCYRPERSPPDATPRHAALAHVLADAGCDLLLCETFPHVGEALAAVDAAVATGVETWVSFTAGPEADLLTPDAVHAGATEAVRRGASAVLVNCIPAARTLPYVEALAGLGVPFGAYANAGHPDEGMGWRPAPEAPERYVAFAEAWVAAGATLVGSCCGTGPDVIAALARRFG
jgi:S-methylmethionine-dependent homocysteine/selenocysteine methylase